MSSAHHRRQNQTHCPPMAVATAVSNYRKKLSQCAVGLNLFARLNRRLPLLRRSLTKTTSLESSLMKCTERISPHSRRRLILLGLFAVLTRCGHFAVADGRCWPCVLPGLVAALRVVSKNRRNPRPRQNSTFLQTSSSLSRRRRSFIHQYRVTPLLFNQLHRQWRLLLRSILMLRVGQRPIHFLRAGCLHTSRC